MPTKIHSFQQRLEAQLTNWIVATQNSFSSVDNEHFVGLINIFKSQLKVRSRTKMKFRVIAQFEDKKADIRTKLDKRQGRVSMSSDVWSSRLYRGYM